jgi:hypothetical protein
MRGPSRTGLRVVLLAGGAAALLAGLYAGLVRLGFSVPEPRPGAAGAHGPLLVFGFVGSLIALERAVALGGRWALLAPATAATGGLLLIVSAVSPVIDAAHAGSVALAAAAAILIVIYTRLWSRRPGAAVLTQSAGAFAWYAATLLWLGGFDVAEILPWMVSFVALTIIGERLELASLGGRQSTMELLSLASTALLLGGATASTLWPETGTRVWGLALLATAGSGAATDLARRMARGHGLPRYVAVAVLAGYGWLALAGILWAGAGPASAGARYDAVVHAAFLGFTLSMIFAHAPVILPAVLRRPMPYHPVLYAPLGALHLTLLVRVAAGDLGGIDQVWRWSGLANEIAVLGFLACAAVLAGRGRAAQRSGAVAPSRPAGAGSAAPRPAPGVAALRRGAA